MWEGTGSPQPRQGRKRRGDQRQRGRTMRGGDGRVCTWELQHCAESAEHRRIWNGRSGIASCGDACRTWRCGLVLVLTAGNGQGKDNEKVRARARVVTV